jgi:hypothetical protein
MFEIEIDPVGGVETVVGVHFSTNLLQVQQASDEPSSFSIQFSGTEIIHDMEVHIFGGPPGTKIYLPYLYKLPDNLISGEEMFMNSPKAMAQVRRISRAGEDTMELQSSNSIDPTDYSVLSVRGQQHFPYRNVILRGPPRELEKALAKVEFVPRDTFNNAETRYAFEIKVYDIKEVIPIVAKLDVDIYRKRALGVGTLDVLVRPPDRLTGEFCSVI